MNHPIMFLEQDLVLTFWNSYVRNINCSLKGMLVITVIISLTKFIYIAFAKSIWKMKLGEFKSGQTNFAK